MTTIVHKRGTGIPAADDLAVGEIAIDTSTGTAYTKNNSGEVVPVGGDSDIDLDTSAVTLQVGNLDLSDGSYSVAVGVKGFDGGYVRTSATGVGAMVKATDSGVAVGAQTEARSNAVAVGRGARGWGDYAMAIGSATFAEYDCSVAIGRSAVTEEQDQVMFGATPDHAYGKPLNLKTYGTMQATDFLDADGNSIVGGDVDLSSCVKLEASTQYMKGEWNALEWSEGAYSMLRIGEASKVGIGMYDSPIYLETDNGIYSFNNFAFLITGGKIQGKNGSTIVGFDSVQAGDFLDANGDSIIGGGGDPDWAAVDDEFTALGYNAEAVYQGTAVGANAKATSDSAVAIGSDSRGGDSGVAIGTQAVAGDSAIAIGYNTSAPSYTFAINEDITTVDFSNATVQATDYIDADGNSIMGGPEWADVDGPTNKTAIGYKAVADRYGAALGWSAKATSTECTAIGASATASNYGTAIGYNSTATEGAGVAVGKMASAGSDGTAVGNRATAAANGIALGDYANAARSELAISNMTSSVNFSGASVKAKSYLDKDGNPATVSPSAIVDAFTTLQTAVADEDTVEGIKTALTNALGGLIEKFEAMSK